MITCKNNAPFFIVGPQRSGTTLLRLILSSHPNLIVPPESHFIPDLLDWEMKENGLSHKKKEVISWLEKHNRLKDFNFPKSEIQNLLTNLHPFTTQSIICTLFGSYANRAGKLRWGDKTPRHRGYLPQILKLFPRAKIIILLRDGRDTTISTYNVPFGPRFLGECALLWKNSIKEIEAGMLLIPKNSFLLVRYEDLIINQTEELKKICSFLGESFSPTMLSFYDQYEELIPDWEKKWHSKTRTPIEKDNIENWKTKLKRRELYLVEMLIAQELKKYNYPISKEKKKLSIYDHIWVAKELFLLIAVKIKDSLKLHAWRHSHHI